MIKIPDLFEEPNTPVALAASSPGDPNKHQQQDPRTREQQRQSELQLAEAAYRQGYRLLQQFQRALHKNYGLFVSRQDRFEEACDILEEAANEYTVEGSSEESSDSTTRDCYELWKYCRHRINEQ